MKYDALKPKQDHQEKNTGAGYGGCGSVPWKRASTRLQVHIRGTGQV